MAESAHVTSTEAIKTFRAALMVYLSKARPMLESVGAEVIRTRLWLQNDQRVFWEHQVRRRTHVLEQAQQALASARLSSLREATEAELRAVRKARQALEEAENKLRVLKRWNRDFESETEPLARQLDKLQTVLTHDMLKAAATLAQTINILEDYAGIAAPSVFAEAPAAGAPTAAAGTEPGHEPAPPSSATATGEPQLP